MAPLTNCYHQYGLSSARLRVTLTYVGTTAALGRETAKTIANRFIQVL